ERGEHAPGRREPHRVVNQAIHHLLLAHGLGAQAVKAAGGRVGAVMIPIVPFPLTEDPEDLEGCERCWQENTGWWFEPLFLGRYPADEWERRGADVPSVTDGDLAVISTPCDYVGINQYFPTFVRGNWKDATDLVDLPRTDMGWPVYPPVLGQA